MRAVVQRVTTARVLVESEVAGTVDRGVMVLVGVREGDDDRAADATAEKIAHLRIFPDESGRMERSLLETGGGALVVSQFTLYGDARKGRRPSYILAARGTEAERLYERVAARLRELGVHVQTGRFGAMMQIEMVADGPVTILLDSDRAF